MNTALAHPRAIYINQKEVLRTDPARARWVFDNLLGLNHATGDQHRRYLSDMSRLWKTKVRRGDTVSVRDAQSGQFHRIGMAGQCCARRSIPPLFGAANVST